jgi:hypothetical protein
MAVLEAGSERRRFPRELTLKTGKIITENGWSGPDCRSTAATLEDIPREAAGQS